MTTATAPLRLVDRPRIAWLRHLHDRAVCDGTPILFLLGKWSAGLVRIEPLLYGEPLLNNQNLVTLPHGADIGAVEIEDLTAWLAVYDPLDKTPCVDKTPCTLNP